MHTSRDVITYALVSNIKVDDDTSLVATKVGELSGLDSNGNVIYKPCDHTVFIATGKYKLLDYTHLEIFD